MNAVHWPAVSAIASALAIGREVQTASPQTNIYSATGRYALAPAAARAGHWCTSRIRARQR
jgi:hypothetical protein